MSNQFELEQLEIELRRTKLQRERLALEREMAQRSRVESASTVVQQVAAHTEAGARAGAKVAVRAASSLLPVIGTLAMIVSTYVAVILVFGIFNPFGLSGSMQFRAGASAIASLAFMPPIYLALTYVFPFLPPTPTTIKVMLWILFVFGLLGVADQVQRKIPTASVEQVLKSVEAAYPALNPESSRYNSRVDEIVTARMNQLEKQGIGRADALTQAVREICVGSEKRFMSCY